MQSLFRVLLTACTSNWQAADPGEAAEQNFKKKHLVQQLVSCGFLKGDSAARLQGTFVLRSQLQKCTKVVFLLCVFFFLA